MAYPPYVKGYSQYDAKRNISSLLRTRTPIRLIPPVPLYGPVETFYDLYIEETFNWLIKEWEADIKANPTYYSAITKYLDNPLLYCYYLNESGLVTINAKISSRNIILGRGAQFSRINKAWRLPYNPEQKNFDKEDERNSFDFSSSKYGRLATSDAEYLKNLIDDIYENRLDVQGIATETAFNGYLNEPNFRTMMRFYPEYAYLNCKALQIQNELVLGPYLYLRTCTKNPYVYQTLLSLNLDPLFDNEINLLRPTVPALFQLGKFIEKTDDTGRKTQELEHQGIYSFYDLLTAKALKRLPDYSMADFVLLDMNGEVFIADYYICNFSNRRQSLSTNPINTYMFINNTEILITNQNLIPLYQCVIKDGTPVDMNYVEISGGSQVTTAIQLLCAYHLRNKHIWQSYGANGGTFTNLGEAFPEFNDDASTLCFDELEFHNKLRGYNPLLSIKTSDNMWDFLRNSRAPGIIPQTDLFRIKAMEDLTEKYPNTIKVYYSDSGDTPANVKCYDPASQESSTLDMISTICGYDVAPYDKTISNNHINFGSYETFEAKNELPKTKTDADFINGPILQGDHWFFRDSGLNDENQAYHFCSGCGSLLVTSLKISNLTTNAVIQPSLPLYSYRKANYNDTGGVLLRDKIADVNVTFETLRYLYAIEKKTQIEQIRNTTTDELEQFVVKYDVEIVGNPPYAGTTYAAGSKIITKVKYKRMKGIDFSDVQTTEITIKTDGEAWTIERFENTDKWFRFVYYKGATSNLKKYERTGGLYNRMSDAIKLTWVREEPEQNMTPDDGSTIPTTSPDIVILPSTKPTTPPDGEVTPIFPDPPTPANFVYTRGEWEYATIINYGSTYPAPYASPENFLFFEPLFKFRNVTTDIYESKNPETVASTTVIFTNQIKMPAGGGTVTGNWVTLAPLIWDDNKKCIAKYSATLDTTGSIDSDITAYVEFADTDGNVLVTINDILNVSYTAPAPAFNWSNSCGPAGEITFAGTITQARLIVSANDSNWVTATVSLVQIYVEGG